jgi:hypothetical protein
VNQTRIDLTADVTLTCALGAVTRNRATDLTLDGHGHTITQACPNGQFAGVFERDGSGALTFANVTITGGHTDDVTPGGGIQSATTGAVTLIASTVRNNVAGSGGGGIWTTGGAVTIVDSTVSGNNAGLGGGGVNAAGDVTAIRSTVTGNEAGGGGGLGSSRGSITLVNSTVTDNRARAIGPGGVGSLGPMTLVYSTVVDNTAPVGGANVQGVSPTGEERAGSLTSFGSVVALPRGGGTNCFVASTTSNGFNFSDDASCGLTDVTDRQNAGDPRLGPLAANGGPTRTRLPQGDSPLLDDVPTASCQADGANGVTTDQRGVVRPQGSGCDIGAVEVVVEVVTVEVRLAG